MDPLKAGDPGHVGGYRLLGRLGGGGMGQVFLGASPGGRKVAVKLIRPEYADDAEFRRRFAREIEAARQVGGFHTALLLDADPDADQPWMVTAYIAGPSLADAVAQDGPLGLAAVCELASPLAEGLAAIHACAIVHRDLKPGNIILSADGPRIIDFGVARSMGASALTTVSAVIGTYGYMSPEQLGRRDVTPRSDIFALGGVLVFAATGHGPFDAPDLPAVIGHILSEPPDLAPLTGPLRDILSACLDKEPDRRPALDDLIAYFGTSVSSDSQAVRPPRGDPGGGGAVGTAVRLAPSTVMSLPADTTVAPGGPSSLALAGPPLRARGGPITLVTFSPDGTLLATASDGGEIRLWDTGSWQQAAPVLAPDLPRALPDGRFGQLIFTPDGHTLLAKAPGLAAVLAWDVRSGQPLSTPDRKYARLLSPDGRFIAAEGKGAPRLWQWDPVSSRHVALALQAKTNKRTGFLTLFSPDGGLVAAMNPVDVLHLWDTATGQRCGPLLRQHKFDVDCLQYSISAAAISPDGRFVAFYGETRDSRYRDIQLFHLWDTADPRRPRRHLLQKIDGAALSAACVAFSADSRLLAATIDGRLRVWDTASRLAADLGDPGDVATLRFSPDNRLLAEAGRSRLRLWDTTALAVAASGPRIRDAGSALEGIDFSPDGALIATAEGGTARVWHLPAP